MDSFPANAISQIGIINADGILIYSNLGTPKGLYLGDREHFKVHLAATSAASDRLFISKPVFGRVSQTWSIQFTRPIRAQGRFVGVVVLSIAPSYLANRLSSLHLGGDDVIALFRPDGSYLARTQDLANSMGKSVPTDRPFLGDKAPAHGMFRAIAAFDKIPRTYAWKRTDSWPVIINVGLAEKPNQAPIEEEASDSRRRNGIAIVLILLFASSIALLLKRVGDQQVLLRLSSDRYRGFFESNTAIKLLIDPSDGRIVDANPAAETFYGYPRDTLLGMHIQQINSLPPAQVQEEMNLARVEQRRYFNFVHRLASGELREVEVYSGPIVEAGRNLLLSVIHDVTARRELEHRLQESEERHRVLVETMAEGVMLIRRDGEITGWNDAILTMLGVDAKGLQDLRFVLLDAAGNHVAVDDYPSRRASRGETLNHELFQVAWDDGHRSFITVSSRPLHHDDEADAYGAVISCSDVTPLKQAEQSLQLADSVFQGAGEAIVVYGADQCVISVNPAFTGLTGFMPGEVVGKPPYWMIEDKQRKQLEIELISQLRRTGEWSGDLPHLRKDGSVFPAAMKITALRDADGNPYRFVAMFNDVSDRRRREQTVWRQANFDALTGLANRKLLEDRLAQILAQARRRHSHVALLFVDLDKFKPVNDNYGHAAGDELLRQVARRMENSLREEDTIARLGGDEFVVVLPSLHQPTMAEKTAEKLVTVLSEPFKVGEHYVEISCSVGIALFPEDAGDTDELLARADAAMYQAKEAGRATWRHG
jgi:diguanylate cyclase (GGDEF)-like protein/PAS domain S-box-containing protein